MTDFAVRRIIIACDAVSENRAGIEVAARLASTWNALLHAVFVQDESLLHLAALPFARQVGLGATGAEKLDELAILRHFEADAARVRAALEATARSHAITSSFAVVRGQPTLAALSVGDRDLLVIEATARPFAGQFRLASRWLAMALEAHVPVLLVRNRAEWTDGIVCAVQAPARSSWRALAAAAGLALAGNRRFIVKVVGDSVPAAEIRTWLDEISPDLAARCRIANVRQGQALDEGKNSLLVVDADPGVVDLAALKALVEHARADVLFIR